MPTFDEEFIRKLRATFKVEAEEHLQTMSANLLELEKSPAPIALAAAIEMFYREAHSLKGAARAVDMADVEAICQALEGIFSVCKREKRGPATESFDALHQALEMIGALLENAGTAPGAGSGRDEIIKRLNAIQVQPANEMPVVKISIAPPAPPVTAAKPPADVEKASLLETVRISVSKLDSHLLQVEDLLVVKAMMAQRVGELNELKAKFDRWQAEWAKVPARMAAFHDSVERGQNAADRSQAASIFSAVGALIDAHDGHLRSLESKLEALSTQAAQDRHSVVRRVDDLLEDSKKLLMLPFSTLAGTLQKIVRDLCRDQAKEADLVIRGGEIEIDKRILEEMKDPLIHILRNCVDHGVEAAAERARLGKPQRAVVGIYVSAVNGNKVEIRITDDGAGVNIERVKQSAVRHAILSDDEARGMDDATALPLVFRSEVTASLAVTAISGRGLGMAIVRTKAESLGGHISIESRPQIGTTLLITLPLTLATFRGILLKVADQLFVAPTTSVERVVRLKPEELHTIENREVVSVDGQMISVARMASVLGIAEKPGRALLPAALSLVVLASGGERVAFVVDEVLHEAEVLVKSLGRPILRLRHISGATVMGSGSVVPVLNAGDLLLSARNMGAPPTSQPSSQSQPARRSKRVLVVEDSITSRMLLKGVLESAGYHVQTAVDGVAAFTALREESFDLVVSDVEMPRMNGIDLTTRIRMDKRLAELPVVLVTALETREERERGVDAGASAYITKSTFDRNNLLEVIERLAVEHMQESGIKVLIVDDSQVARLFLSRIVETDPQLKVVGTAANGLEALDYLAKEAVDIVLMDVQMPEMDGFETTRRIMEWRPLPIVICSGAVKQQEVLTVFRLMEIGAVAFVEKPVGPEHPDFDFRVKHLVQTLKLMSEVKVVRRWARSREKIPLDESALPLPGKRTRHNYEIVGIGASTGGPSVIQTILTALPKDFSLPILIVQHIAPGFVSGFATWLQQTSGRDIDIAEQGARPLAGHTYLAPDEFHMGIQSDGRIALSREEPENGMRPSVSHMFRSLANVYGERAIGVLLTGMGKDGAADLKKMKDRGGATIVQDRETSIVFGMPGEAVLLGAQGQILSADKIAPALLALTISQAL